MVIEEISREGVLKASRESLGLSAVAGDLVDDPMLVALLRRAAGILCPCAPSTIISSVLEGLQYLVEDKNSTEGRLANLADRLIISGDLLELNQVTTDDPREGVDHRADEGAIAQPDERRFIRFRAAVAGRVAGDRNAVKQLARFVCRQYRRIAFFHDVLGAAHGVGRVTGPDPSF